jgi:transcriptional regulator with XRE-family HTH domain
VSGTIRSPGQQALCKKIISERQAAGLTQSDLAKKLRCHQSMIARFESGERRIDVVELIVLCRAIGCNAEDVLSAVDGFVSPEHRL